jgi:pSer/pThr/pTyr-binding forkhead associated (FHA) protein
LTYNNNDNTENVENAQSNNNNNKHQPDGKPTRAVAKATTASSADNTTSTTTAENSSAAAVTTTKTITTANTKPFDTIHIDVLSGPNEGLFYDLQPRTRLYSWIGRSQGRKFKQKGISLPKDLECSTTHGRFEYTNTGGNGPKFYYTDVGSTNGTHIDGYECEPNVSYVLSTGMNILCGKTRLKVTLLSLD